MEVSEIIEAVDGEEFLSQYCDFEEKGGELWAISPFNPSERTPSFSYRPESKIFYDFSVGIGGNLIDFVMRKENVTIHRAVQILKKFAQIYEKDGETVTRMEAAKIARRYRQQEKTRPQMTAKVLPEHYMERYEFRQDKLQLWADEGISWDSMRKFDVRYDAFDDRIVYPIRDLEGNIFTVSGRTCDPDYKAKGLRKYTYMHGIGTLNTVYGFSDNHQDIMDHKEIILFEGAKSVLLADTWGIHHTGALMTSHLSPQQFEFLLQLSNFHGVKLVFALDSDVDITKDEQISKLCSYARVAWVQNREGLLEPKMSPVDQGKDVWDYLYQHRRWLS